MAKTYQNINLLLTHLKFDLLENYLLYIHQSHNLKLNLEILNN